MNSFAGGTAVITGAASGFGLATSRVAARLGMNIVMADVQADALAAAVTEVEALGAVVLPHRLDIARAEEVEAMAQATVQRFGVPSVVFNNAGVGGGGLVWEASAKEWEWVLGVNVMGVIHGVRVFTPLMLDAASRDPAYRGHIVNTASMAGLLSAPNMGVYNVSKHAVVTLSETLYQDLRLVTDQVTASVLCPYFVPTGIADSGRNRPRSVSEGTTETRSQLIGKAMAAKAVSSGKVSAADIAEAVFDAIRTRRFYIYSHAHALEGVRMRLEDVLQGRNPSDPFAARPELGEKLRRALRDVE